MSLPSPTVSAAIIKGATRRGTGRWVWVPTIATIATPASAEITAGTDYTNQISSLDGFAPDSTPADFGNAGSPVVGNVSGPVSLGSGTVTFNCSNNASIADARATFNDGSDGVTARTSGYWVDCPNGIVTSGKCRVYAATVQSANLTTDLDTALMLEVVYSLQAVTGFIAIPTA